MDRLDSYRALIAVVDAGGFTPAAERLAIPRSTLSTVIAALEDRVGARLLHRTTRTVTPTEEGLRLAERARDLLEEAENIEGMFGNAVTLSGRVRISMPGRIAHRIVIPALPEFLAHHPHLLVDLRIADERLDLVAEGLDLVLRVGTLENSTLICRRLCAAPFVNCAAPGYLARHRSLASPGDLEGHRAVAYGPLETGGAVALTTGAAQTRVPASVIVDSTEGYIAAGLSGLGIIELPRFDVIEHLASGTLVEILPDHPPAASDIALLYPSRRQVPARIAAARDWLIRLVGENVEPRRLTP